MRPRFFPDGALALSGRTALILAALAALPACGVHGDRDGRETPGPLTVATVRPERRTLTRTLKTPGTVEAMETAILFAKTAGYLERIAVDRGDPVRRGQLLAVIAVPEMAGEREVAEAQLRQAEADLDLQRTTAERLAATRSAEPGAVTPQQVDEAEARRRVADATLSRLQAELRRLEVLLAYARIRAPFDGVVTDRFVDPGAMIQLATTSAQAPIVTLMNMDTVRVFVDVPEPDVPRVTRGTPARLSVASLPGGEFLGTVTRFSTALDPGTRTMKTEIDLPNPGHRLRPGMYGVVTLELERRDKALTLPATALLAHDGVSYVFVVVDGRARRVAVRTGLDDGIVVEILEGLADGDVVITAGKGLVTEGMRVAAGEKG